MACRLVELLMGHSEKITLCLRSDFDLSDSKHNLSPWDQGAKIFSHNKQSKGMVVQN